MIAGECILCRACLIKNRSQEKHSTVFSITLFFPDTKFYGEFVYSCCELEAMCFSAYALPSYRQLGFIFSTVINLAVIILELQHKFPFTSLLSFIELSFSILFKYCSCFCLYLGFWDHLRCHQVYPSNPTQLLASSSCSAIISENS